ncbi:DNA photolyase phr1 [Ophidiomyces ophidiicola]|nr:DNA photolyase phr1 [Ophidiomyces ophidiicola]
MPSTKRKGSTDSAQQNDTKRGKPDLSEPHPKADVAEKFGIVLRDYYPSEMSNARCQAYMDGTLERPIETLQRAYEETTGERKNISEPGKAVVHWFKSDLRLLDNRALHSAYLTAQEHKVPLVCLYIFSPEDLNAHLVSPARVDMILRTLSQLQRELAERDIPLYVETQESRKNIPKRIVELCQEWGSQHLFANLEYEVDELRREAKVIRLCAEKAIKFDALHDTCVVRPGVLTTQQGKQYAVYTPWYRNWVAYLKENPENLECMDAPGANAGHARTDFKGLFDSDIPSAPENKQLPESEQRRFRELYPEGEHEAMRRLETFLKERGKKYDERRDFLAGETTSILSPYFASGVLSARTAISKAYECNGNRLDRGNAGYTSWISEVAWRDFYKHVLAHWPFICMNKCFKPEFTNLEWEYDSAHFEAWCAGRTGFPIVDAAMRQLQSLAWMHNRARMIVSSFLSKDLLIDWRLGEQHFMKHLIDGDFASNHGGWGFGSSTGVDPQPYFRIFNPLRQSERFDATGEYIRRWVPELREVKGAAVHDPYGRGAAATAQKHGYPRPVVEHGRSRERALDRYKKAAARKE